MKVSIDELLIKKGKTRYWLAKEVNITYSNMVNLCSGHTTSIRFEILELICKALGCTPNDILKMEE